MGTRKNILFITHHFLPEVNGTATRTIEIINKLLEIDPSLRIFVVTPPPSRPYGEFPPTFKLLRKEFIFSGRVIIFRVWAFQPQKKNPNKFQRILNYSIFTVLSLPTVFILAVFSKLVVGIIPPTSICLLNIVVKCIGKTLVTDVTDLWHEEALHLKYVKKRSILLLLSKGIELLSIKISDNVTVASRTIGKIYSDVAKKKDKIFFLPTPISYSNLFTKIEKSHASKRNIVIYAGNFGKPQALHIVLEAFLAIKNDKQGGAKLILIGGGEEKEKIKRLIDIFGLNKIVELLPPISREKLFKEFYPKASIGLVPLAFSKALIYAIPTKVYEYLANGLPFVSYGKSYELKFLSLISKAGIHIDSKDPQMIAKAIFFILKNREIFSKNALHYSNKLNNDVTYILRKILYKAK